MFHGNRSENLRVDIADRELHEPPPRSLCARPVPIEEKRQGVREGVRLGQIGIELEGLPHVAIDLWPRIGRPLEAVGHHHRVVTAERGVGQRELWIANNRALQELPRVEVVLFGCAPLEETGLQVQVVRISVAGWMTHELAPLVVTQPKTQTIGHDRAGDLVLDIEQVGRIAVVLVGPELPAGSHVDELSGDQQSRSLPFERARQNRLPLEAEDTAERAYPERPQSRNLFDQTLGNTVTQVVEVRVVVRVSERQYGQ
jgi:hypothetical protein